MDISQTAVQIGDFIGSNDVRGEEEIEEVNFS
jgi:hypothetical protein